MLKWTDQTFVPNPKPVMEMDNLYNHSTPLSPKRLSALSKVVRDLTAKSQTK